MTEEQRAIAAAATKPTAATQIVAKPTVVRKYDPTALIGLIIAVAPDLTQELTNSDLGLTQQWVSIIRILGLFIAAYGRSLLFRKPMLQDGYPAVVTVVEEVVK